MGYLLVVVDFSSKFVTSGSQAKLSILCRIASGHEQVSVFKVQIRIQTMTQTPNLLGTFFFVDILIRIWTI